MLRANGKRLRPVHAAPSARIYHVLAISYPVEYMTASMICLLLCAGNTGSRDLCVTLISKYPYRIDRRVLRVLCAVDPAASTALRSTDIRRIDPALLNDFINDEDRTAKVVKLRKYFEATGFRGFGEVPTARRDPWILTEALTRAVCPWDRMDAALEGAKAPYDLDLDLDICLRAVGDFLANPETSEAPETPETPETSENTVHAMRVLRRHDLAVSLSREDVACLLMTTFYDPAAPVAAWEVPFATLMSRRGRLGLAREYFEDFLGRIAPEIDVATPHTRSLLEDAVRLDRTVISRVNRDDVDREFFETLTALHIRRHWDDHDVDYPPPAITLADVRRMLRDPDAPPSPHMCDELLSLRTQKVSRDLADHIMATTEPSEDRFRKVLQMEDVQPFAVVAHVGETHSAWQDWIREHVTGNPGAWITGETNTHRAIYFMNMGPDDPSASPDAVLDAVETNLDNCTWRGICYQLDGWIKQAAPNSVFRARVLKPMNDAIDRTRATSMLQSGIVDMIYWRHAPEMTDDEKVAILSIDSTLWYVLMSQAEATRILMRIGLYERILFMREQYGYLHVSQDQVTGTFDEVADACSAGAPNARTITEAFLAYVNNRERNSGPEEPDPTPWLLRVLPRNPWHWRYLPRRFKTPELVHAILVNTPEFVILLQSEDIKGVNKSMLATATVKATKISRARDARYRYEIQTFLRSAAGCADCFVFLAHMVDLLRYDPTVSPAYVVLILNAIVDTVPTRDTKWIIGYIKSVVLGRILPMRERRCGDAETIAVQLSTVFLPGELRPWTPSVVLED